MKEGRKTIQVGESVFNEFVSRKEAIGAKNSTECLQELLQQEVERTTTLKIERGVAK